MSYFGVLVMYMFQTLGKFQYKKDEIYVERKKKWK